MMIPHGCSCRRPALLLATLCLSRWIVPASSSPISYIRRVLEAHDKDPYQADISWALMERYLGQQKVRSGNIGFDIAEPDLESIVLNSLVSYFTPSLTKTLQETLGDEFDPLVLGDPASQQLGQMQVGDCSATAEIVYQKEILRGLSGVVLDELEMVPESDQIDVSFFDGAHWNATWELTASFPLLTAEANATLKIHACGTEKLAQSIGGMATVEQPSIYLHIAVQGDTSNLILFQSTSKVTRANILDLRFNYESIQAQLGSFGTNLSEVNFGLTLGEMLTHDATVFELLMKDALQAKINEALPFEPNIW
ncbi:expressed unknown protein [Seminavis robusta]|uniref:Uncharacterized protein n=1 Tax=Seminavis robusta TaxID=568900 RepID=A0A9N8E3R2_9STRA|nr:expressed unknown protein [Seminavis robusta]|eukprot:Sro619_g176530.1 n/a (310) ;mRNA; f:49992-50921